MRIAAFYFAIFAAVGILLPYIPIFYRSLGFSGFEMAILASVGPLLSIIIPPAWGFAADKAQRGTAFLKIAAFGSAATFVGLCFVRSFTAVAFVLAIYALFSSALTPLADSLAAVEAKRIGTDYARLRLWGSIGFIVASFSFGAFLSRGGTGQDVVYAGAILLFIAAFVSLLVKPDKSSSAPPTLNELKTLLVRPIFILFLFACMVHWAAASIYHLLFAVYLRDLGVSGDLIGLGFAVAVIAEVVVMWRFRSLSSRFSLLSLVTIGFFAGALRWFLIGILKNGPLLASIQVLHGLSFGMFFIAAVAYVDASVPASLRATGRTLFASIVFGIGGLIGNAIGGHLYDHGGGNYAFFAASALDLLAPVLLFSVFVLSRRSGMTTKIKVGIQAEAVLTPLEHQSDVGLLP